MLRNQLFRLLMVLALVSLPAALPTSSGTNASIVQAAPCEFCPPQPVRWDFNGDGFEDLVVDVPLEAIGDDAGAGAVHVLYGGQDGVTAEANQFLSHETWPRVGNGKAGSSFDSGDFNGDGYADLAVGADTAEGLDGSASGVVDVLYGSSSGLTGWKHQVWSNWSAAGWPAGTTAGGFGGAVAAGDFNGDGFDDLAIGAVASGGYVIVLDGSASGLTAVGSDVWTQDTPGIPGVRAQTDVFGSVLEAADFGRGSADDLVIGAPRDFVGTRLLGTPGGEAGSVHLLYGSDDGLTVAGTQHFTQGGALGQVPEDDDLFGATLAHGDFNGDGSIDLAIGVPEERIGSPASHGIVHIIYGSPDGLDPSSAPRMISAATLGVAPEYRKLGFSLTAGNFGTKGCVGCDDLAIGAPLEDPLPDHSYTGAVYVMYGNSPGNAPTFERWAPGGVVPGKFNFGIAVTAHDFGKGGHADLVAGALTMTNIPGAGGVVILYGSSNGLSTSGVQTWSQASPGIPGTPEVNDHFGWGLGNTTWH